MRSEYGFLVPLPSLTYTTSLQQVVLLVNPELLRIKLAERAMNRDQTTNTPNASLTNNSIKPPFSAWNFFSCDCWFET